MIQITREKFTGKKVILKMTLNKKILILTLNQQIILAQLLADAKF
jgi:predicted ATP-grasp superfamily ATP-dependent carboligase